MSVPWKRMDKDSKRFDKLEKDYGVVVADFAKIFKKIESNIASVQAGGKLHKKSEGDRIAVIEEQAKTLIALKAKHNNEINRIKKEIAALKVLENTWYQNNFVEGPITPTPTTKGDHKRELDGLENKLKDIEEWMAKFSTMPKVIADEIKSITRPVAAAPASPRSPTAKAKPKEEVPPPPSEEEFRLGFSKFLEQGEKYEDDLIEFEKIKNSRDDNAKKMERYKKIQAKLTTFKPDFQRKYDSYKEQISQEVKHHKKVLRDIKNKAEPYQDENAKKIAQLTQASQKRINDLNDNEVELKDLKRNLYGIITEGKKNSLEERLKHEINGLDREMRELEEKREVERYGLPPEIPQGLDTIPPPPPPRKKPRVVIDTESEDLDLPPGLQSTRSRANAQTTSPRDFKPAGGPQRAKSPKAQEPARKGPPPLPGKKRPKA